MKNYRLIIFDVEGTLAVRDAPRMMRHAEAFFIRLAAQYPGSGGPLIALAANQGGVGLRRWMELNGFGKPNTLPTQREAEQYIQGIANHIRRIYGPPDVYISFAFQSQKGKWAPVPPEGRGDPRWQPGWRKPASGMLVAAMTHAGVSPGESLMVSDDISGAEAARAAGCDFVWADQLLGKPGFFQLDRFERKKLYQFAGAGLALLACLCCLLIGLVGQQGG